MDTRELLNKKKGWVVAISCICIVLAIWMVSRHSGAPSAEITSQAYYTDDDGQTYFADAAGQHVPFLHNNKEAVLAFVYRTDGKTSVNYMMRMSPSRKSHSSKDDSDDPTAGGKEYKRPGEKQWHSEPPGPIPSTDGSQPEWITP